MHAEAEAVSEQVQEQQTGPVCIDASARRASSASAERR